MSEDDIFRETRDIYLRLIHPVWPDEGFRIVIGPLATLAPSVPDEVVAAMIIGASWRERLLGLCIAMAKGPGAFSEVMLRSLRDLRGISIVPTCAALGILARRGLMVQRTRASRFAPSEPPASWAAGEAELVGSP